MRQNRTKGAWVERRRVDGGWSNGGEAEGSGGDGEGGLGDEGLRRMRQRKWSCWTRGRK